MIEKDYLLAGVANHPQLASTWVFKGGSCLRKCYYYETFWFSEDLDFTVVDGGPDEAEEFIGIFAEIAEWLRDLSGINLVVVDEAFGRRRNRRGTIAVSRCRDTDGWWSMLRSFGHKRPGRQSLGVLPPEPDGHLVRAAGRVGWSQTRRRAHRLGVGWCAQRPNGRASSVAMTRT
jgi:hypothetical protein